MLGANFFRENFSQDLNSWKVLWINWYTHSTLRRKIPLTPNACFQQQAIFKTAAISFPPVSLKNNDWFGMRNRNKNSEFAIHDTIFSNFDNNKPFLRSIYLWHRIFITLLEGQLLPGNISYCDTLFWVERLNCSWGLQYWY